MQVDEFAGQGATSPLALKGTSVTLHLYVEDVDSFVTLAVKAGARVTDPAAEMFWGDRYVRLTDPYGHQWSVATHVRDVSPQEIAAAAKKVCDENEN